MYGHFPITLSDNGDNRIRNWYDIFTQKDIHRQIDLAEESKFRLGISANTFCIERLIKPDSQKPNAIIAASCNLLKSLAPRGGIRIDSDGSNCWSYCHLDVSAVDRFKEFIEPHADCQFWSSNANGEDGWISLLGRAPCYPSIVNGCRIQLLNSPERRQIIYASSPSDLGIQFNNPESSTGKASTSPSISLTDTFSESEIEDDGTWNGCLTPDEVEELFESVVRELEASRLKIVQKKPLVYSVPEANSILEDNEQGSHDSNEITLHEIFPEEIADALVVLSEHLPYDAISIAVTFLTALAGMLRLGTFVEGNERCNWLQGADQFLYCNRSWIWS